MANIAELTELMHRLIKATQNNAEAIRENAAQMALLVEENRRLTAVIAQTIECQPDGDIEPQGNDVDHVSPQRYLDGSPIHGK